MAISKIYRGRFAPSPTGPLHFGSLIAATGSYLQAKHQNGEWLLRIDDIDPPREQKGAADNILRTLEDFGFEWDQDVLYQSHRLQRYQEALDQLNLLQLTYPCTCSRTYILNNTPENEGELIYPGFCRNGPLIKAENPKQLIEYSTRLRCNNEVIHFNDVIQGQQHFDLENHCGDFIIKRRDQHFSYQLASGIDDAEQGITEVVRGVDLLSSTPNQLYIQKKLNLSSPQYCHLPIAVNKHGQKLSKQSHAAPIKAEDTVVLLFNTLNFLGQMPPIDLINANQKDIWSWAKTHWRLELVPSKSQQIFD